jgi:hypothetical protein
MAQLAEASKRSVTAADGALLGQLVMGHLEVEEAQRSRQSLLDAARTVEEDLAVCRWVGRAVGWC